MYPEPGPAQHRRRVWLLTSRRPRSPRQGDKSTISVTRDQHPLSSVWPVWLETSILSPVCDQCDQRPAPASSLHPPASSSHPAPCRSCVRGSCSHWRQDKYFTTPLPMISEQWAVVSTTQNTAMQSQYSRPESQRNESEWRKWRCFCCSVLHRSVFYYIKYAAIRCSTLSPHQKVLLSHCNMTCLHLLFLIYLCVYQHLAASPIQNININSVEVLINAELLSAVTRLTSSSSEAPQVR